MHPLYWKYRLPERNEALDKYICLLGQYFYVASLTKQHYTDTHTHTRHTHTHNHRALCQNLHEFQRQSMDLEGSLTFASSHLEPTGWGVGSNFCFYSLQVHN